MKITLALFLALAVIATVLGVPQGSGRGPQNQDDRPVPITADRPNPGRGPQGPPDNDSQNNGNGRGPGSDGQGNQGNGVGRGPPEARPAADGRPPWANGGRGGSSEDWDWPDYEIPYDPSKELCVVSGPRGCPTVHVPINWQIFSAQGDWYLYASDNDLSSAGCIGCNTIQISYWQNVGPVPQFILNACCLISCQDPSMAMNGGVTCGNDIGTGFIWPNQPTYPGWGIVNYENLGTRYTLFLIGFESREYMILFGCITYKEGGETKTSYILRVYTRQPNPTDMVLNKIRSDLDRYGLDLEDYMSIPQGSANQCIYV